MLFEGNLITDPSSLVILKTLLTYKPLQISPLRLNLNLNPLYSILGGSTIRADPLIKKPNFVCFLWNPL